MLHRTKKNTTSSHSVPNPGTVSGLNFRRRPARAPGRSLAAFVSGFAILLSLGACLPAAAQGVADSSADDVRPDELLQDRFDRRTTIPGTQIGGVTFQASAVADLGFNDNVFALQNDTKSDFFADYGARLGADYGTSGFRAHLDLNGQERQYLSLTNEDFWQGGSRLTLSDQLGTDLGLFLNGGVQRLAVPRSDPNTINGFKPATYLLYDAEAGTSIGTGAHNLLTLTTGYSQTIFDQSFGTQGLIITNDRDRQEIFGDVRFDHTFFGEQKVFVEIRPDGRSFGRDIDASGRRRASNGVRGDAGFVFDIDSLFLVSLTGGYQTQTYADAGFGKINEPDAIVDVLWSPTRLSQIDLKFVHEYFEDIFIDSPGYVHDLTTLTVSHELHRDLLFKADVSYDARQLERSPRSYDIITSETRLDYEAVRGLIVGVDYTFQNLTSSTSRTFDDNILMLTLKKQF
ncbi:outer membrane beta-barrel protein [Aliidongia sp.]|uniref:outer membrane beta-barrel protein n=1 Tax=Aliidongia sp. TaxID=1914230 RepID=UPI002DDD45F6|nr:outer membrane beta-barrel protein [Aliidongia sp.]